MWSLLPWTLLFILNGKTMWNWFSSPTLDMIVFFFYYYYQMAYIYIEDKLVKCNVSVEEFAEDGENFVSLRFPLRSEWCHVTLQDRPVKRILRKSGAEITDKNVLSRARFTIKDYLSADCQRVYC
jgi:hypothetical protein